MSTLRCLNAGLDLENPKGADRIANAVISSHRDAAKTDILFKDHKPIGEDGLLKTREVSNCIGSTTEQLGDFLAIPVVILQERNEDNDTMIRSTEEHLAGCDKFNKAQHKDMDDKIKRVAGSMDVVGQYINISVFSL